MYFEAPVAVKRCCLRRRDRAVETLALLRQAFDAINNAFITVPVTAVFIPAAERQEMACVSSPVSLAP
jgi:hypothetical protein